MGSGTPKETIRNTISDYLTGDKSDGLIFLEHEITEDEVNMFIEMYPQMLSNGWKLANIVSFTVMLADCLETESSLLLQPDTMHLEWYQDTDSEDYIQTALVAAPSLYQAAASKPAASTTVVSSTSTAPVSSSSASSSTSDQVTASSASTELVSSSLVSLPTDGSDTSVAASAASATRSARPGNTYNTSGALLIETRPGSMIVFGILGILLVSFVV